MATHEITDLQVVVTDNKILTVSGTLELETNTEQVGLRNGLTNDLAALPHGMLPPTIKCFTLTAVSCRFVGGKTIELGSMAAQIDSAIHYWESEIARTVTSYVLSIWTPRYHDWADEGTRHEQDLQDEADQEFHDRYLENMTE